MGTRILLLVALAGAATVTLLGREAPAGARRARSALSEDIRASSPAPGEVAPETARPRVVDDASGVPVAGARLEFHRAWEPGPFSLAVTDANGCFDLPKAETLVVRADGYPPAAFRIEESTEFRLKGGEARTFTIVDEEGRPGAHARVEVYGDYELDILLLAAEADASGTATLVLTGKESLLARLRGYACEDGFDGGRVVLRPGFAIGGRVVDSAGRPVVGASVHVRQGGG